jgi:hypothetical protein
MRKWGMLTPQAVSSYINFDGEDQQWTYRAADVSMAARQAEGVAYLWNTLAIQAVALLADEVGMGKTYQALGVIAMLWHAKPDARILIMAPNRDICRHWMREYKAFLQQHYREQDHVVRNGADGGPVHAMAFCPNLPALVEEVKLGWGRVFLTTTHSLSGLLKHDTGNDKGAQAAGIAQGLRGELRRLTEENGFDLVIIDEAHSLRNVNGGSQRVEAARAFFGKGETPLARKALLLTATPSHSGLQDVANILGYFKNVEPNLSAQEILRQHALRRLRLMRGANGVHHNKFAYRHEQAMPARFGDNANAELFFAMYQKELASNPDIHSATRRPMYGYLEGFESVGSELRESNGGDAEDSLEEVRTEDFSQAADTLLLRKLSARYHSVFKAFPPHPKYGALVERVVNQDLFVPALTELHLDKHLVFVRRIPSVRELTQRVNRAYDEVFLPKICEALGVAPDSRQVKKWKDDNCSRAGFVQLCAQLENGVPDADSVEEEADLEVQDSEGGDAGGDASLNSKIAQLFVVKKDLKRGSRDVVRTDCSNVRQRFRKPESLFAVFMEPASDYADGHYEWYRKGTAELKDNFVAPAREQRFGRFDAVRRQAAVGRSDDGELGRYDGAVHTAWGLVYQYLNPTEREKLTGWRNTDIGILENFGNYLNAGFLFASPVMIELYCWYKCSARGTRGLGSVQTRYAAFVDHACDCMAGSLLLRYFRDALASFDSLCGKITDHNLDDWKNDWRTLTGLQDPAWFASGQSGNRQRLILGFNSPFFPNVLIATSVFQEGVNLHLQCRQVHHYGIAWTPGDNEQRVGRVDRLFGCVNQQLLKGDEGHLRIGFPYLEGSFDEDQVASFVHKKRRVEQQMDDCVYGEFDRVIDTEVKAVDWKAALHLPHVNANRDPYPATFSGGPATWSSVPAFAMRSGRSVRDELAFRVADALEAHDLYSPEAGGSHDNALFLADPVLAAGICVRRQPILISKQFSTRFSGLAARTTYHLTFQTPLATRAKLAEAGHEKLSAAFNALEVDYPMVRLALNPDEPNSWFYLHMKTELPVLIEDGAIDMLTTEEICIAFQQLRDCSDQLEQMVFGANQDLCKDDLAISATLAPRDVKSNVAAQPRRKYALAAGAGRWQTMLPQSVQTRCLMTTLPREQFVQRFPLGRWENGKGKGASEEQRLDLHLLQLNHRKPFLKFSRHSRGISISLPFPTVDAQQRKVALLETWFDTVIGDTVY